jgi:hypothetical protein
LPDLSFTSGRLDRGYSAQKLNSPPASAALRACSNFGVGVSGKVAIGKSVSHSGDESETGHQSVLRAAELSRREPQRMAVGDRQKETALGHRVDGRSRSAKAFSDLIGREPPRIVSL